MAAGAAGFSSHPLADALRLGRPPGAEPPVDRSTSSKALVDAAGPRPAAARSRTCRCSAVGGITPEDEELLIELSLASRMPGRSSRASAPARRSTRRPPGWDNAKRFVDEATAQGAAVYSMAMSKPFNRTFDLAAGTKLYEGALEFHRMFTDAADRRPSASRCCATRRSATRSATRSTTRTAIPAKGPTLPPPHWAVPARQQGEQAGEREVRRPLARRHRRRARCAPDRRDARHRAVARTSPSSSSGRPRRPSGSRARKIAQADPHMIVGTSDGGAHLDRDDGAEAHSYFLQHWVREWQRLHARGGRAPDHRRSRPRCAASPTAACSCPATPPTS